MWTVPIDESLGQQSHYIPFWNLGQASQDEYRYLVGLIYCNLVQSWLANGLPKSFPLSKGEARFSYLCGTAYEILYVVSLLIVDKITCTELINPEYQASEHKGDSRSACVQGIMSLSKNMASSAVDFGRFYTSHIAEFSALSPSVSEDQTPSEDLILSNL